MSFFYADIKTDELKVHGHTNSTPGQIEFLDADSQKTVTLKAPSIIESNVTITLPTSNGTANNILTSTDNNGTLSFATVGGDLTIGANGSFTINGISNTSTIQSTANITLVGTNSIYFTDSNAGIHALDNGNLAISATTSIVLEKGSDQIVFDIGSANTYINFSNTVGESGYGIKANSGVMQYRGSGAGSWSNIGSDTLAGLTDIALSSLANNNILVYDTSDSKWHNESIPSGYYGSFYDTTTQTNPNAANVSAYNVMRLNTTAEAFGVSIQNNSQVIVAHSAVYNIQFSAQLDKTDSGTDIVNIWLLKNGTNVSNTDTELSLVGNAGKLVAAWNFVLSLAANDYIELAWKSPDSNLRLFTQDVIGPAPAIPSVILTVQQVAYAMGGTSNFFADLLDVNTAGKTGNSLVQYNVATSKWEATSNLTLNTGNYLKLGTAGNIVGSNGGNLTISSGNVDVIVSGEAHIHNNLRVTGNIFGPPNGGNLTISSGNVDVITSGHLNILGNAHIPYSNTRLAFGDQTTYINSPVTGNLDIRATAGNVNITANHDVVITTNSASTIRFVGPNGSSPMNLSFQGANTYLNFGSTTGLGGSGIRYDGTNIDVGSSGSWSGISNTTLSIAGRQVSLGGSNTVGFSDLTGTVPNSQLANSTVTVGPNTLQLGSSYVGLDLSSSNSYNTSNLVGTITNSQLAGSITNDKLAGSIANSQLANSSVTVGNNTLRLGTTYTGLDLSSSNSYNSSNLVGTITNTQLAGSITNSKLSNSSITIGNQSIALGSAGNIGMSNLSDVSVGSVANKSVLTYDTGTTMWIPLAGSFFIPSNITTISTSNTYTPIPSGTRAMRIRAVGAGGGGGGELHTFDSAGGGGSGGYGEIYVNLLGAGMSGFLYVRTVLGIGGAGGVSALTTGNAGVAGSNSNIYLTTENIGSVITNKILEIGGGLGAAVAAGSSPANGDARGGLGGAPGTVTLTGNSSVYGYGIQGMPGQNGLLTDGQDLRYTSGGNGGNSMLGPGGIGVTYNSSAATGTNGGGGGGGSHMTTLGYRNGAAGGNGFAIIEFF